MVFFKTNCCITGQNNTLSGKRFVPSILNPKSHRRRRLDSVALIENQTLNTEHGPVNSSGISRIQTHNFSANRTRPPSTQEDHFINLI